MTTQARKQKGTSRAEHRFHNPQGVEVKNHAEAFAAQADVSAEAVSVDCKLELNNGPVTFTITAKINPNTHPYVVTGGRITSGTGGATWDITGGFIGDSIRLDAKRAGQGSSANTITIVGEYQNPPAYRGTYGFDGATSSFKHTTRYLC
ncbi:hypothetical protein ABT127_33630 [Streptomyces sp. NPDC001904]|uniref:hypothetical protein n=1 Tax=Streptomyces sp. NPDC001904 TaxID=3154531 RepID=UPI00332DAEA2